jgi:predicted  nucleic acid-binding Zn-ribbon protein
MSDIERYEHIGLCQARFEARYGGQWVKFSDHEADKQAALAEAKQTIERQAHAIEVERHALAQRDDQIREVMDHRAVLVERAEQREHTIAQQAQWIQEAEQALAEKDRQIAALQAVLNRPLSDDTNVVLNHAEKGELLSLAEQHELYEWLGERGDTVAEQEEQIAALTAERDSLRKRIAHLETGIVEISEICGKARTSAEAVVKVLQALRRLCESQPPAAAEEGAKP